MSMKERKLCNGFVTKNDNNNIDKRTCWCEKSLKKEE